MINWTKIKGYTYGVILIVCLTYSIVTLYNSMISTIIGLTKGDDYIYYDPKGIPLFLFLPVMVVGDLFMVCLFLPFRKKTDMVMRRLMIPVVVYSICALIVGLLLAVAIFIYPLGSDYYQCKSTSMVSSGSYYARSKEMCMQMKYSPEAK